MSARSMNSLQGCNVCGGRHHYGSKPYWDCQRRSRNRPSKSTKTSRKPTPRRARSRTNPGSPGRTGSARRQSQRRSRQTVATDRLRRNVEILRAKIGLAADDVAAVLGNSAASYLALSQTLLQARPLAWRLFRRHGMCAALDRVAEAIDPGAHDRTLTRGTAASFVACGAPIWVAEGLARTPLVGLMLATGTTNQQRLALRALVLLVCPNLAGCPTCATTCLRLADPAAAHQLRIALMS